MYNWLRDEGFISGLTECLTSARKILTGEIQPPWEGEAARQIEMYRDRIEAGRGNEVSNEAWKFLHYYSGYLLQRLQE